jgi:hypothetical protein
MIVYFQIPRRMIARLSLAVCVLILSACASPRIERTLDEQVIGMGYRMDNLFAVDSLPTDLRRVAVLPVFADKNDDMDGSRFNALLEGQLRGAGRFEVLMIDGSVLQARTGLEQIPLTGQIPLSLVAYLQARGVDGVFQMAITDYSPYRPFVVGVHARLFSLGQPTALWAVDEHFRSSDRKVVNSARSYALSKETKRYPFDDSYGALRGPFLFSQFVIHTIIQTLPPASGP